MSSIVASQTRPLSTPIMRIVWVLTLIVLLTFVDFMRLEPSAMAGIALVTIVALAIIAFAMRVSAPKAFLASCLVLPFAGSVAAFAPLAQLETWSRAGISAAYSTGWPLIFDILFKSYVATILVVALMRSMSIEQFIHALAQMKVPHIFIMLFTFLYRFTDLFREQISIMRDAARSRAPHLHGWRLLAFYGRMSGNLFVRAYERGEQIHSAMLSRGYDGTLPSSNT